MVLKGLYIEGRIGEKPGKSVAKKQRLYLGQTMR
jgi:hypothetical protein